MEDCIDSLGDETIFSTLDCNSGYWQVPVAPADRDKTSFTTFLGTFRFLRMPFGLKNAPATFQRALDIILSGVRWQTCLVYLDDVIVFSRTHAEHLRHLDEVLTLLGRAGLSLKLKKCSFFRTKVDYLGHVISPGKLEMALRSKSAFADVTFPQSLTQLRSFLGACNVYRRFVQDFSKIARPLTLLTRKDAKPDWANPNADETNAFETLKQRLVSPPILSLPRPDAPYVVDTDASAYQLGCTLLQPSNDNENVLMPVGYWSYALNEAERNYSATERECYAVVWAVTSLRPYLEGTRFTVRTDHDALRWLMSLTETSGRLTRWRLRLAEFDFTIVYRPGRTHQVPDALSRLVRPHASQTPVDDEVPTFESVNVLVPLRTGVYVLTRRQKRTLDSSRNATPTSALRSNTLENDTAIPRNDAPTNVCDTRTNGFTTPTNGNDTLHNDGFTPAFDIRTNELHRSTNANDTPTNVPTTAPHANDTLPNDTDTSRNVGSTPVNDLRTNEINRPPNAHVTRPTDPDTPTNANDTPAGDTHDTDEPDVFDDDAWDDCDDVDPFDLARVRSNDDATLLRSAPDDRLPAPLTFDEILAAQRTDTFCQGVLQRQSPTKDRTFYEHETTGLLMRRPPHVPAREQIVLPASLRPRLLTLTHNARLAGHPGQNRMFYTIARTYYWPQMAADVAATVRNCHACARNRVKLRKHLNRLKLFPATRPLESLAIDILGPLPKTRTGKRFLLIVTDRFTKLTQVAPLRTITAYHVAVAFCEVWVFKYGIPRTLLSDNGPQFASKFFTHVCQTLGVTNVFTSAYHPQTNGQVERYNRTLLAMLRNYVNDNQNDWDEYASALTYAYNTSVHRSTRTTPFDLVLSRPPPPFSLEDTDNERPLSHRAVRLNFVRRLDTAIRDATTALRATQERYKRDFDKRVRKTNRKLRANDYVYLDPTSGNETQPKLQTPAVGPFRVIANDKRTVIIDRDGNVERVSADRVVYAPRPERTLPDIAPHDANVNDIRSKVRDGPTYTVDKILAHERDDDGTLRFHIKWTGYDDPTWEPRTHVPEELVSRYFRRLRRRNARYAPHDPPAANA